MASRARTSLAGKHITMYSKTSGKSVRPVKKLNQLAEVLEIFYRYKKSLEIPWKSLEFSWKISKESEKSKDFQKLGKGAKIQGFLRYFPRNPRKLGFHESVILFSNIQGFPGKAWKLGNKFPRKAWKTWKARIISF